MTYTPVNWKNRAVEKPMTFIFTENGDGTVTLKRAPGEVYEPGTPVNAENLNQMDEGIRKVYNKFFVTKVNESDLDEETKKKLNQAPDAEKLGGKAPQYYLPAVNLLVNSDFLNPVNKRGQTVYNETDSFTIDRWTLDGSGSISILSTGVVIQPIAYASLAQIVPNSDSLTGKHMTFAAKTTEYGTVVLNFVFGQGSNIADSTGSMELIHWFGNILFIRALEGTAKLTVEWAALYEGSYTVETLPPYVSTHPRVEMLKVGNPVQPRNLLDNSYFVTPPVNQRGQTVYKFDSGYTIDRWRLHWSGDGTVEIREADNCIRLHRPTHSVFLFQHMEHASDMVGKTYTLAAKVRYHGRIGWFDNTQRVAVDYSSNDWGIVVKSFTVGAANCELGNCAVEISNAADQGFDIAWIALYEGAYTAETLPPYVPKGYAAELRECQRYYFAVHKVRSFMLPSETATGVNIVFPVPMRVVPTISYAMHNGAGFSFDRVEKTMATGWGQLDATYFTHITASADL